MTPLQNSEKEQLEWIKEIFISENLNLDYTVKSIIDVDIFLAKFNNKFNKGTFKGKYKNETFAILYSLSLYIGELLIILLPKSRWINDYSDESCPLGGIKFGKKEIWQGQKIINIMTDKKNSRLYSFFYELTKFYNKEDYIEDYEKRISRAIERKWFKWNKASR